MKKSICISFISLILFINTKSFCQWSANGSKLYYNNGNIGIGTSNPLQELHIVKPGTNADLRLSGGDDPTAFTDVFSGATAAGLFRYGKGYLHFATNGISRMQIAENGLVGIGTANPAYKLDVAGSLNINKGIDNAIALRVNGTEALWFDGNYFSWGYGGNANYFADKVGIGTKTPQSELAVNGKITAKEVEVTVDGWADYVFKNDYKLLPLEEIEKFIKVNKHLPGVPSEKEVLKNGNNLGKMDATLLQKVEELTLHLIEQNKLIKSLQDKLTSISTK